MPSHLNDSPFVISIPQQNEKFNTNSKKIKALPEANKNRTFSYAELVDKKDLQGFVIDKSRQVKIITDQSTGDVEIDSEFIVNTVKAKCSSIKTNAKNLHTL